MMTTNNDTPSRMRIHSGHRLLQQEFVAAIPENMHDKEVADACGMSPASVSRFRRQQFSTYLHAKTRDQIHVFHAWLVTGAAEAEVAEDALGDIDRLMGGPVSSTIEPDPTAAIPGLSDAGMADLVAQQGRIADALEVTGRTFAALAEHFMEQATTPSDVDAAIRRALDEWDGGREGNPGDAEVSQDRAG